MTATDAASGKKPAASAAVAARGDVSSDSAYWSCRQKRAGAVDVGHACKECKQPFTAVGEPLWVRRGGRIELRYHAACFSGEADPRTQAHGSYKTGHLAGSQAPAAPQQPFRKMRTSSHW